MASRGVEQTIQDFDEQWWRYIDNSGFYGSAELFADIIHPFLTPDDIRGKTVVDIGSDTGRIVRMLLSCGARRIYAVEPGSRAFAALKHNTQADCDRLEYLHQRGEDIPDGMNADLVLSVGVIHHIEDPRDTMKACFEALRPGGRCLLWLYGREGNEFYLGLKSAPPNRAKINPQPCRSFGQISQLSMRQAVRVMARRDSECPVHHLNVAVHEQERPISPRAWVAD